MVKMRSMSRQEISTRIMFGVILTASVFFSWGKWVVLVLGILFFITGLLGWMGFCLPCLFHNLFGPKTKPPSHAPSLRDSIQT